MKLANKLLKIILVFGLLCVPIAVQAFVVGSGPPSIEYIVDASNANQGVIGNGKTIKAYVDAIGTSKSAVIKLNHTSIGNTTSYTLTTSEIIPSNITLEIKSGAILSDGGGAADLTINGSFPQAPGQECFDWTGSGTVTFGDGSIEKVYPQWWNTNVGDGITVANTAIETADTAFGVVHFVPGTYIVDAAALTPSNDSTWTGNGVSSVLKITDAVSASIHLIDVSNCNNIRIDNLKLDINKINNAGETHAGGGGRGIYGNIVTNSWFTRLYIHDGWSHGLYFNTGSYLKIDAHVYDVDGSFIALTGCTDIEVKVLGDTCALSGFKIDGGRRITLINPISKTATGTGIMVDCLDSDVDGLEVIGGSIYGSGSNGFESAKSAGVNSIKNIRLIGGEYYENGSSGVYIKDNTVGVIQDGVAAYNNGNTGGAPHKDGIRVAAAASRVLITGCRTYDDQGVATQVNGISFASPASKCEVYGNSSYDNTTKNYDVDVNCTEIIVDNFIARVLTIASTVGVGEDDLHSVDIPQNAHLKYNGIRIRAAGWKTGANNNKTIKLYYGATSVTTNVAANDTNDWQIDATILFYGDATQSLNWRGYNGTTLLQGQDLPAEDMTAGDITLKVTGECVNAGDVVNQRLWMIEFF